MTYSQMQTAKSKTIDSILLSIESEIKKTYRFGRDSITSLVGDNYKKYLVGVDGADYYKTLNLYNRLKTMEQEIKGIYIQIGKETRKTVTKGMYTTFDESYLMDRYTTAFFSDSIGQSIRYSAPNPLVREVAVTGDASRLTAIRDARLRRVAEGMISPSGDTLTGMLVNNLNNELTKTLRVVKQGLINGQSYVKQAQALKKTFDGNAYNALRVVRTEGNRLANAGTYLNSEDLKESGVRIRRQWVATLDGRTRDSHQALDGQYEDDEGLFHIHGLSARYPGDFGDPAEDIACFIGETPVYLIGVEKIYRRHYTGEVLTVKTSSGMEFTVTPNHPIATTNGFIPAKLLNLGDNVISMQRSVLRGFSKHNKNYNPISFAKVFNFFGMVIPSKRVGSTANTEFHGDIGDGDINIKLINSKLVNRLNSSVFEFFYNLAFSSSGNLKVGLFANRTFAKFFMWAFYTSNSIVSFFCKISSFFLRRVRHSDVHTLRPISRSNIILSENTIDNLPTDIFNFCKLFNRDTSGKCTDNIVSIDRSIFSGHVYNLQTKDSMYIIGDKSDNGNGVVVHNCRCTTIDVVQGLEPTLRRGVNPVTGKSDIASYRDYDKWKKQGLS